MAIVVVGAGIAAVRFVQRSSIWDASQSSNVAAGAVVTRDVPENVLVMADGSGRFIKADIDHKTLCYLVTKAGGEVIVDD